MCHDCCDHLVRKILNKYMLADLDYGLYIAAVILDWSKSGAYLVKLGVPLPKSRIADGFFMEETQRMEKLDYLPTFGTVDGWPRQPDEAANLRLQAAIQTHRIHFSNILRSNLFE